MTHPNPKAKDVRPEMPNGRTPQPKDKGKEKKPNDQQQKAKRLAYAKKILPRNKDKIKERQTRSRRLKMNNPRESSPLSTPTEGVTLSGREPLQSTEALVLSPDSYIESHSEQPPRTKVLAPSPDTF